MKGARFALAVDLCYCVRIFTLETFVHPNKVFPMSDIAGSGASDLSGRLQASVFTLRLQLQKEAAAATIVEEAVQASEETAEIGDGGGSRLVDILA